MVVISEKNIQAAIIEYLELLDRQGVLKFWRQNSGVFRVDNRFIRAGVSGIPDICGYVSGGKALFIEVKRIGGKKRLDQVAFVENAKRFGAIAFFASSVDDVQFELKQRGYV